MSAAKLTRRSILKTGAAGLAVSALPFGIAKAQSPVVIGAIYSGPKDDFGWNQSHAVAMEILRSVPNVTVIEEENVPETDAVNQTMESMINIDGANLLLPTSFGYYRPFVLEASQKHPDVQFRTSAPLWTEGDPTNAGSYFGYLNQAHYVDGVAAGLSTTANKLGFVAAKPVPTVLSNINSFYLGAKSVNPHVGLQVIFTGEWSLPVREAEATNALIDAGCDVVTCHVDGPKVVIETAEGRGAKTCGHNTNQAVLAPNGFITGAEYKWETIYRLYAASLADGEPLPNLIAGGFHNDMLQNSPFGAGATPEAIKAAEAAQQGLRQNTPIYAGPLKDNRGNLVIEGTKDNFDPSLDTMDYLLEGIVGSTT